MTISIRSIPSSGLDIDFCEKYSVSQGYGKYLDVEASFTGRIHPVDSGEYELNGLLSINGLFNCDKCLEEVSGNYSKAVTEVFSTEEKDDCWLVSGAGIELKEAVLANIYSLMPMKVLCKDDCKGLCPICGANFNERSCGCEKPRDSRFDVLSSFFKGEEV